jgi:amino acid transporter
MGLAFASAFYTLGFGEYLATFVPLPTLAVAGVGLTEFQVGALFAGLVFIAVNYPGAKETGSVQVVIVTLLVGILFCQRVYSIPHGHRVNCSDGRRLAR